MNSRTAPRLALLVLLALPIVGAAQHRGVAHAAGGSIVVARAGDIDVLDPAVSQDPEGIHSLHVLYNGLLGVSRDNTLYPDLARSMPTVADNGRSYTFHLRGGLRFADGTPLTASDVAFSINRAANPKTGSWAVSELSTIVGYGAVEAGKAISLAGVHVVDPLTVRFSLSQPDAVFPAKMSMINFYVVEPSAVARYGTSFGKHVSGSGPFMFSSYTPGQSLVIVRNPHYYLRDSAGIQLPYLDRITWLLNVNPSVALLKLERGEVDMLADGVAKESYASVAADPKFGPLLLRVPSLEPFALAFNEGIKPFDSLQVRRALAMGVNRTRLIRLIGKYRVTALNQRFPKGLDAYDPGYVGVQYDPAGARALLAKAGFPRGFSTEFLAGLWPDTNADTLVGQAIQQDLAAIGVKVSVRSVTQATALTLLGKPKTVSMFDQWWGPDFPEASDYIETIFRCGQDPPHGFNTQFYCNPRADALLAQAESTLDPAKRLSLYRQVQRIILDDVAIFPLFQLNYVTIRPLRLANFYIHPNWQWDYAYYRLAR